MNRNNFTLAIALLCVILYIAGCTRDQVDIPEPCDEVKSYNDAIRDILRNKCNTSGCHDGASGVGNYNSYSGVRRVVETGEFRQEVVIEKTMPKDGTLSDEEFSLLRCWSENGFPEN
ncbi:MAG: hypothetical protein IPL46_11885 [Saprospiraceae bacterium]|nr:hypothetical protein [Saprospiraceae bacterium]